MVKELAGNEESGKEMIALLLDQQGADVQITKEMVIAAASCRRSGEEMMRHLLDRRGADVQITEEVVRAAVENVRMGKEVMKLLLDRRGAEVQITENIVKAAAGNAIRGKEVMRLLLDRRGADVQITEEVVKAAARNGSSGEGVMGLLLDRRGADVQITEEVVKAAAGNGGKEVMRLLLDRRGAEVQITEEVVRAAVKYEEKEVMKLLYDRLGAKRKPSRIMESFSKFPELPAEIRDMIWTLSLPSRRFIQGENRYVRDVVKPRHPAALLVNKEAHAVASRHYKRLEYFKPLCSIHVDLAVDAFDEFYLRTQHELNIKLGRDLASYQADLSNIRNIVIDADSIFLFSTASRLHNTNYCGGDLSSLREVIFAIYGPATLPVEGSRDPVKEILEDEGLMKRLRRIKRASEKWFREGCPICHSDQEHSYQKPPAIVKVPKITFAMVPCPWGNYGVPAKLVPFELTDQTAEVYSPPFGCALIGI